VQITKPSHSNKTLYFNFSSLNFNQSVPVAALSKTGVYGPRLLGLWVRMPPETRWSISWEWCVFPGSGFCAWPISRAEESYRVFMSVCV